MEENRDDFGEDMDIESLAAALGAGEGSDAQKDIPPVPPVETPVFSDDPPAPYESAGSASQDGAAAKNASQVSPGYDSASPAEPADKFSGDDITSQASGPAAGESKDSDGGDIDALIKKYEEIPAGKKEMAKMNKQGGGKALPVVPIAAAAAVIVIAALLKFVVFKPAPALQQVQPKQSPKTAAAPASSAAPAAATGVDYPGGALLLGETADGMEIKIIETDAVARDIKLFYQKNMTEKGFELSTSRKNRSAFNMKFFKGQEDYSVSVVPHAEKNLIIVTRAK